MKSTDRNKFAYLVIYYLWFSCVVYKLVSKHDCRDKGSLPKKREYIKTFDLKEGGGQFENLIIQK